MENPFESVVVTKKPRVKRTFKLNEMFEFFPEESSNSLKLKRTIADKLKELKPSASDFEIFKTTQMFFNRYFYKLRYSDEKSIDDFISSSEEFELFKTI